jgi:hypothetical protein
MAVNKSSTSYIKRSGDAKQALNNVAKNLENILAQIGITTEDSLDEVAQTIHNTSQAYAPLDTGELRESSYISSEKTEGKYTVEIGYTDPKAPYVHEIGPYKNPTTPGTDYKFLQRAVTETEADIEQILADAIKNTLRG